MRASGDWVHPTFNAEPRYHKPVLIYWLMLVGTTIGGDNPFGARLVSSLAGVGTVLLVWAWGRRMLGESVGRLSALILATAPIMVAESKLATTDATLTFFVVGCQFALWELSLRSSRWVAAVFWLFLGLAILTKSPAGPVLIAASAVASWWWGGPTACWRRLHWRWGPLLAAAVVVPWNVAILLRSHGEYYQVAVGFHIIQRATRKLEEHGGFPGYYIVTGMVFFYPWSALLPGALAAAWVKRRETPLAGFLMGWLIGPLVLLECVRTKLLHYYLPAIPAAALLVGWLVVCVTNDRSRAALKDWAFGRLAYGMYGVVGTATAAGLAVAAILMPATVRGPLLVLAALIAVGTAFALHELIAGRTRRAVWGLIGLTAVTMATASGWLLPAAEPYRISAVAGLRLAVLEAKENAKSVLGTYQPPGTVFALGHPAPVIRSRAEFAAAAESEGKILAALVPKDLEILRAEPRLAVEVREAVRGFDVDKWRTETLYLAVIRPQGMSIAGRPGSTSRR